MNDESHDTCINPVSSPGQHSASLSATDIQQARTLGGSEVSADDGEDGRSHFGWSGGGRLALLLGSLVDACNAPSGSKGSELELLQGPPRSSRRRLFVPSPSKFPPLLDSGSWHFWEIPPMPDEALVRYLFNWSVLGAELPR